MYRGIVICDCDGVIPAFPVPVSEHGSAVGARLTLSVVAVHRARAPEVTAQ